MEEADAHQPCHAGSLYAESVFPEGDRGANTTITANFVKHPRKRSVSNPNAVNGTFLRL